MTTIKLCIQQEKIVTHKMNKQTSVTRDYVYSVQSLVYLADANYQVCASLYKKLHQQNLADYNQFALITANNAFDCSVIILRSLIESSDEKEIRIEPIIESFLDEGNISAEDCMLSDNAKTYKERVSLMYPEKDHDYLISLQTTSMFAGDVMKDLNNEIVAKCGRADLDNLKEKFKKKGFIKIRHLVSAHKNKDVQYVTKTNASWLDSKHVSDLGEIVKDTRLLSYFLCGYELPNRDARECLSSIPQSLL